METEGAGRVEVKRDRLLNLETTNHLAHTLAWLKIESEQANAAMHRFVDAIIEQAVTPPPGWQKSLASWRKTIVERVANPKANGGADEQQTAR